ncbi:hypothetical protein HR060_12785 [Catenovulum sp. SM1970]|uniref:hypothetical protein n=1 Tax=Marinifaba aquimaris TaxID=2741323 RepID=UPI001573D390|nr:hypothetical protein [Marinifaba aquimaris]NTS77737.1 hypothetical protein [Marinifaba aquimaris]
MNKTIISSCISLSCLGLIACNDEKSELVLEPEKKIELNINFAEQNDWQAIFADYPRRG